MVARLVNLYRGQLIESVHYGQIAVVDSEGKLQASVGESDNITYWRSAAKPFQALPVIYSGAAEKFAFTDEELAIMAASHSGEEQHVRTVQGILAKIGLEENALQCGVHPPIHKPSARKIFQQGEKPREIHNNCSGKHAGLLTLCRYHNWSIDDYLEKNHPLQQFLLDLIAEITEYSRDKIFLGVDGCGVVVFGLPLEKMAYAYARLANPGALPEKYREAARRITAAMRANPGLIGGTGRFNTDLLQKMGDRLVAKSGAEAVFCLGIDKGPGVAIKISDGNSRAVPPAVIEVLRQLKLIDSGELEEMGKYYHPAVLNNHKDRVGKLEAAFELN